MQLKCKNEDETQEHILKCHELKKYLTQLQTDLVSEVQYSDIFADSSKQLKVTKVFKTLLRIRERLLGKPDSRPATAIIVDPVSSTCLY